MTKAKKRKVGVIVGAFQVDALHAGHRHLFDYVLERHAKGDVFVILGNRDRAIRTPGYDLTVVERGAMVQEEYPDAGLSVLSLNDQLSDLRWSEALDALLEDKIPGCAYTIYGGHNSMIMKYHGKHETHRVPTVFLEYAFESRQRVQQPLSREARRMIIYANATRPPFVACSVDLAIVDFSRERTLLIGKKYLGGSLMFLGGFYEKEDTTALDRMWQEKNQEAPGIEIRDPTYITAELVSGPWYEGSKDGVMTVFFAAEYVRGQTEGGDDADSAQWIPFTQVHNVLVPWHHRMYAQLRASEWWRTRVR